MSRNKATEKKVNITLPTSQTNSHINSKRRRFIVFAIALIIVICISSGAAIILNIILNHNQTANTSGTSSSESSAAYKKAAEIDSNSSIANQQAESGNLNGAIETYDNFIKSSTDNATKADYTLSKASMLYNNEDYNAALSAALEAYSLNKTMGNASFIADIYAKKLKDTAKAIEYYNIAKNLVSSNSPVASSDKEYYAFVIKQLQDGKEVDE